MKQFAIVMSALLLMGTIGVQSASAHKIFKEELEKKYEADKVKVKSCNACHVSKKPKTERNDFGKLFEAHKEFKGKEFSKKHKELHDADDDEGEEKLEKEMAEAFKKAIADIEKMESEKDGPTYGELIKTKKMEYIEEKDDDDE